MQQIAAICEYLRCVWYFKWIKSSCTDNRKFHKLEVLTQSNKLVGISFIYSHATLIFIYFFISKLKIFIESKIFFSIKKVVYKIGRILLYVSGVRNSKNFLLSRCDILSWFCLFDCDKFVNLCFPSFCLLPITPIWRFEDLLDPDNGLLLGKNNEAMQTYRTFVMVCWGINQIMKLDAIKLMKL